jgi:hypothetical protein
MGWLFSERWPTRRHLQDHLLHSNGVTTHKHCWKGNNLWAVQSAQKSDGTTVMFVALYLTAYHGKSLDGWGYKDMDESAGPCKKNCPLSFIELVEAHEREHGYGPIGYAAGWRDEVRAYHARGKLVLTEGQKIKVFGNEYTVGERRRGGTYFIWDYTARYNLPRRMFRHVEVLS